MIRSAGKLTTGVRVFLAMVAALFNATNSSHAEADTLSAANSTAVESVSTAAAGVELVGATGSLTPEIGGVGDGLSQPGAPTLPSTAGMSQIEKVFSGGASSEVLRNLKQFGYELFQRETASFTPARNVSVGPHYVLGIGDEVIIHIWGQDRAANDSADGRP